MIDLKDMMPHSKSESKMEKKDPLYVINEVRLYIFHLFLNLFI